MVAVGVNGTAIMAALPTMQRDIGLAARELQWAVNAYLVVSAVFIIVGGQAADQVRAHRISMLGLALFGVASVIIATAASPAFLLSGRALQGLAAAFAVPGTLASVGPIQTCERVASTTWASAWFMERPT